ncbi:MAG: phage tail protein [Pseudomonas sp.]|nr:phage tail protein [Pseudomonas sp.]
MTIFASCSEQAFFFEGVHEHIPEDAIEVSQELYHELYQALCEGAATGVAVDFSTVPPSLKVRAVVADPVNERAWRDSEMVRAGGVRDRHRDEQELFRPTTLTPERFVELLGYIQKLRDWPQSAAFPDTAQRPVAPAWLAEQT